MSNLTVLKVVGVQFSQIQELELEPPNDAKISNVVKAWNLCQRYLARHDGRPYVTGIPPLQAVLRLTLNDQDILNADGKLEIPSEKFFALGAAFVGLVCAAGENIEVEFDERWPANLPKLGLATDEEFAMTFSRQFLGQCPRWGL